MDRVRVDLPNGIDPPNVQRNDIDSAPIPTCAVAAPKMSTEDLQLVRRRHNRPHHEPRPGVAQVSRVGEVNREINVIADPAPAWPPRGHRAQIGDALRNPNASTPRRRSRSAAAETRTVRVLGSG